MTLRWRWFLVVIAGLMLTVGGLYWDALIHSQSHDHLAEESLLTLANPGHVVFGLGLVLTTLITLAGFTISWLGERQRLIVPVMLYLVVGLAGAVTLIALARTG